MSFTISLLLCTLKSNFITSGKMYKFSSESFSVILMSFKFYYKEKCQQDGYRG